MESRPISPQERNLPSPGGNSSNFQMMSVPRQRSSSNPPRAGNPSGMGGSALGRAPGSGRPSHASSGIEAKRFDTIEHRLSTLEEKEKQTAMDLARSTGFLRNELTSLKQMGDQRWDALHAQHKSIDQQLARARESSMGFVKEELVAQREKDQEWLLRLEANQQAVMERIESWDSLIKAKLSDEGISTKLRDMSGKLQDTFSLFMSPGATAGLSQESTSVSVRGTPRPPSPADVNGAAYNGTAYSTGTGMQDSMSTASKMVNESLSEKVLSRALETAAEAGANAAMEQLHDITAATNTLSSKHKDLERRMVSIESKAGVLTADPSSARSLGGKFCC